MTAPFPKRLFRLSALCLLFAAPIVIGVVARTRETQAAIASIERESIGLRCALAAGDLLADIERFRLDPIASPTVVNAALARLAQPDCAVLTVGPRAARSMLGLHVRRMGTPRIGDRQQATLPAGDSVLALLLDLADTSGLSYDTNVDAVSLGDAVMARIPAGTERLDQGAAILALAGNEPKPARATIVRFEKLVGQARALEVMADDDFEDALLTGPWARSMFAPARSASAAIQADLTGDLDRAADGGASPPGERARLRRASIVAGQRLLATSAAILQTSFDTRVDALRSDQRGLAGAGAAAIVVGCALVVIQLRALRRRDQADLARARERAQILETQLARQTAERALRLTEQQFRIVFDGSEVGMAALEAGGERIDPNAALRLMFGGELDLVHLKACELLDRAMREGRAPQRAEQGFVKADGRMLWTELSLSVLRAGPEEPVSAILVVHDITEHKTLNARLDHETLHDALTGVPNRVHFIRRLARAIATGERFAVVFADLDRFKDVNDRLGHHVGDDVLRLAAARLATALRPADFVARLHGDEFAVMISDVAAQRESVALDDIVGRIGAALELRVDGTSGPITVTASIGLVRDGSSYDDPERLLRDADAAMYRSKRDGRARITTHVMTHAAAEDAAHLS